MEAWIAYAVHPDEADSTEEGVYNRQAAIRDWNEWPQGCTHIGADGLRKIARHVLTAALGQ